MSAIPRSGTAPAVGLRRDAIGLREVVFQHE
jgi:hypothetical protein